MALEPITREEQLLSAVASGEAVSLTPITREEMFLAKAAGMDVDTPEPITRREVFWSKISGGSGGDTSGYMGFLNGTIDEINDQTAPGLTKIRARCFYSASLIRAIDHTTLEILGDGCFCDHGSPLTTVRLMNLKTLEGDGRHFKNCSYLTTAILGTPDWISYSMFEGCNKLRYVDIQRTGRVGQWAFYNCTGLESLVIRGESVPALANANAFQPSSIESGTGFIYVPSAVLDEYKSATNWSVYADQFRAIEGSEYE